MSYETLEYTVDNGVAFITLAREDAANALNLTACRELAEAALAAQEDSSVRAVVLSGKGRMFCAGGDLGAMAECDETPKLLKRMTIHLHAAVAMLARMDAPVIAAVNGTAAGAGFSLVCAADLAIAAENAKFTLAYTAAGLTPDGSSTYFLPRIVGRRRTLELIFSNRVLSAAEALDWGIVNQVVPKGEAGKAAAELAAKLAQGPTTAFGEAKRLVLGSSDNSLETQMELEGTAIAQASSRRDGQEGVAAFLAKRAPRFSGV
jgi:2-(1,2-epoxy-1,2-dihydrophenyl)acetyl-CoA isomerase